MAGKYRTEAVAGFEFGPRGVLGGDLVEGGAEDRVRPIRRDEDDTVHVAAYRHSMSEYLTVALAAGFTLRAIGEWLEPDADPGAPPRLLSLLLER